MKERKYKNEKSYAIKYIDTLEVLIDYLINELDQIFTINVEKAIDNASNDYK